MKQFKLHTGKSPVYEITKKRYESVTKKAAPFVQTGKDGCRRFFAVCPACDNPIQLVGLYKPDTSCYSGKPYGRHYNRSVEGVAYHNEQAYRLCPHASRNYGTVQKTARKEDMTGYERAIYETVRDHFDHAIYILQQDTGLYISKAKARDLLREYIAGEGWMYRWATLYNIPWMLLYLQTGRNLYGSCVHVESELARCLAKDSRFSLEEVAWSKAYRRIITKEWLRVNYMLYDHKRVAADDGVKETVTAELSEMKEGEWITLWEKEIEINNSRFPNLICSDKAKDFRNESFLKISHDLMPGL